KHTLDRPPPDQGPRRPGRGGRVGRATAPAGADESSLQRTEVLARGLDRDGVGGRWRARRDGPRARRGNRPRWHRADATVPPGVLTTTWSPVSGPGTVSFSNASALNSTATFSASGAYVLRLTVSDGALAASDDVAVTINPAPVQSAIEDKIDPALRDLMQANPQALLPVIVEMQHPVTPFVGAPNVDRALGALDLLRQYGIPVAALSLIDGAAGFANAAGIDAVSLAPTVARIHHDATVGPRPSVEPPVVAPPDQLSGTYP